MRILISLILLFLTWPLACIMSSPGLRGEIQLGLFLVIAIIWIACVQVIIREGE